MFGYSTAKPGDVFITDYAVRAVILPSEVSVPGELETWLCSENSTPSSFKSPLIGQLVYRSGGEEPAEITVVNKVLWDKHLAKFYHSQEKSYTINKELLQEAAQNLASDKVITNGVLLNRVRWDVVEQGVRDLLKTLK